MSDDDGLTERQREFLSTLPATTSGIADAMGLSKSGVGHYRQRIRERGYPLRKDDDTGEWVVDGRDDEVDTDTGGEGDADAGESDLPDLSDVPLGDDPSEGDLTDRERYIATELQTGATVDDLATELDERPSVVTQHIRDLKRQGWHVYIDDSANHVTIEGDHTLRSSEHTGTRTRKANRWWEATHNALVRGWKQLDLSTPDVALQTGNEDWVTHLSDLHAGDEVRDYEGDIVYRTGVVDDVVQYITEQSVRLARKHGSEYDTAWVLWGGDMVTNEAIYEGQYEDLDAWLDEQVDVVQTALLRQLKTFASEFPAVHVGAIAGNHGEIRASGSSKKANADLILYKAVRNTVAALQQEGVKWADKISFTIGQARGFVPLKLRGGAIHGQLRHGQDRKPQAETSARYADWLDTLMDTMNSDWGRFNVAWIGHHHVSGRIPWNGPPVFCSPSPKPGGEYVRQIGKAGAEDDYRQLATCHGVSDDGVTGVFPVDARHFSERDA